MEIYIYTLSDPNTNTVRYVGKTVNLKRRLINHISEARKVVCSRHVTNWVKYLLLNNKAPIINQIDICSENDWEAKEIYWIAFYKSINQNLCNHSYGGIGVKGIGSKSNLNVNQRKVLSERARGVFRKFTDYERISIWNTIKNNTTKEAKNINNRITRHVYFQVKSGRVWNDITGLIKPILRGKSKGNNHPIAKITYDIADEIRREYRDGDISMRGLGNRYSLSVGQVYRVLKNQQWVNSTNLHA